MHIELLCQQGVYQLEMEELCSHQAKRDKVTAAWCQYDGKQRVTQTEHDDCHNHHDHRNTQYHSTQYIEVLPK